MASEPPLESEEEFSSIQLKVVKSHRQKLIGLMQSTIARLRLHLFSVGLIAQDSISEEFKEVSKKDRMQKILMHIYTRMLKLSEEDSKKLFNKFLTTLEKERCWESLKDDLSRAAEKQRRNPRVGKPSAQAFRQMIPHMVDMLYTSVVSFPGYMTEQDLHIDDTIYKEAINPKAGAFMSETEQLMDVVERKIQDEPEDGFQMLITLLLETDPTYFENIINNLESDLEKEKTKIKEKGKEREKTKIKEKGKESIDNAEEDDVLTSRLIEGKEDGESAEEDDLTTRLKNVKQ